MNGDMSSHKPPVPSLFLFLAILMLFFFAAERHAIRPYFDFYPFTPLFFFFPPFLAAQAATMPAGISSPFFFPFFLFFSGLLFFSLCSGNPGLS